MKADLWIADSKCRIIYRDNGAVCDLNDYWNNRCSAEMECRSLGCEYKFHSDERKVRELNVEWNACKNGA